MSNEIQVGSPADATSGVGIAAVAIGAGEVGAHCGLYYRSERGSVFLLHLAFHLMLEHEAAGASTSPSIGWIEPKIPREKLEVLAALCEFVAEKYEDGEVPYGFRFERSKVGEDGVFVFGKDEQGLTCATFVLALCERAQIALLDRETWAGANDARKSEDRAAQDALLKLLASNSRAHAKVLEAELGATRFRAEEVAAASGAKFQPLTIQRAAPAGAALLDRLRALPWW